MINTKSAIAEHDNVTLNLFEPFGKVKKTGSFVISALAHGLAKVSLIITITIFQIYHRLS